MATLSVEGLQQALDLLGTYGLWLRGSSSGYSFAREGRTDTIDFKPTVAEAVVSALAYVKDENALSVERSQTVTTNAKRKIEEINSLGLV